MSNYNNTDRYYMAQALNAAYTALVNKEFPVGCVIAYKKETIITATRTGTINNKYIKNKNEVNHAEINALKMLSILNKNYERSYLSLYSTLEPCLMCLSAIVLSGISKIVYAYEDIMGGGTHCDFNKLPYLYLNSNINITRGVLRKESISLFKYFFSDPDKKYLNNSKLSLYTLKQ